MPNGDHASKHSPPGSVGHLRGLEHGDEPETAQHQGNGNACSDPDPGHHQRHDQRKRHRPRKGSDGDEPAQRGWGFVVVGVQNHSARASLAGLLLSSGV